MAPQEARGTIHGTRRSAIGLFALLFCAALPVRAQTNDPGHVVPGPPPSAPAYRIEDLNYVGGEAAMPPFSDSLIDPHSAFREGMFRIGMAFRVIEQSQYAQNTLDPPVRPDDQVYVGQRWFAGEMLQPIFTTDLRQLGLRRAQLCLGGVWNWVSWNPAGPKALQLWNLYLYKAFGEDRVEIKAGYVSNNMNFVGFFVGGSTATGAQGVYAVLPFEVGLSFFPLTAPSFDIRIRGPRDTYLKSAFQRSLDPNGGPAEVTRNHTGFRFLPHGDKLLLVNEAGFLRDPAAGTHQAWFRAGYVNNRTPYVNQETHRPEPGNYCVYALMDYQLLQTSREHPARGLYAGGSFETVPETMNAYVRYYEARMYKEAPFRSRPGDVLSVLASRTGYSSIVTDRLISEGSTVWRAGTTLTGSYSLHASAGNYLSLGISYVRGPAITPRVPDALNFMANWSLFF